MRSGLLISGLGLVLGITCCAALAGEVTYDLSSLYTFGDVSQRRDGVIGGETACGPTSAVNSFIYLQNRFGVTGLVGNDPVATINALSVYMGRIDTTDENAIPDPHDVDGVTIGGFVNGKKNYIKDHQTGGPAIETHMVALTLNSIYSELTKGQDLEMWINWPEGGAHFVTLTSISWNDNNSNNVFDNGDVATKLDFLDPYGSTGANGTAVHIDATIVYGNNGWFLNYSGGAAGNGSNAFVQYIVAESPVPLPAAVWSGLVLLAVIIVVRAIRSKRASV